MSFIQYAAGQGQLAILENGIFLVDGGAPAQNLKGDRLEIRVGNSSLSWPLLPVDFNSLWTAYAREHRQALETKINQAAGDLIQKPLDLVRASKLSAALNIDADYVSLLKKILFDSGLHLTKLATTVKARRREEYLNYLEGALGAEPVEFDPTKLRELVKNFVDIMRDRRIGQFDAVLRRKIKNAIGDRQGFFISCGKLHELKTAPAGSEEVICINGVSYINGNQFSDLTSIDSAFEEYTAEFTEVQGIRRAAGRAGEIDIGIDKREFGILIAALKKGIDNTTLDFNDWGITLNKKTITVYIKIPEYALRDWRDVSKRCYLMPACKVAVSVSLDPRTSRQDLTAPFALGGTSNPFVSGSNICLGTASYNLNADLPLHLSIVKYLSEGHKIITTGYGRGSFTPYAPLSHFPSSLIRSEEDLRKAGIPITNEVNL